MAEGAVSVVPANEASCEDLAMGASPRSAGRRPGAS
jgi:hypothetical protein